MSADQDVFLQPLTQGSALQNIFKDYLNHLVQRSSVPFSINLHTAIPDRPRQIVATTLQHGGEISTNNLDIRILTPAFYSRFVHYSHTWEAFDRECTFTDEKNRTLWISHPELLPFLLPNPRDLESEADEGLVKRSPLDELRWKLLKKLRCPPAEPAYPVTPKSADFNVNDIRAMPYSELDRFVRGPGGRAYSGFYRRTVTKLFLAQRFTFGFPEVVDILDFFLRLLLCWFGSRKLVSWAQMVEKHSLDWRSSDPKGSLVLGALGRAEIGLWWLTALTIYVCGCHLYGLLKGCK